MIKKVLVVLLVGILFVPAFAKGLRDPKELESFLDGIMAANLNDEHIAGATLSVVKDGKIFFKKGYGYADIDKRVPVDPDTTLFRPGSISKLFTWTSIMQMYEQGKIDLHADVNKYLKGFQVPATFKKPITMADLLTHSAGFEDSYLENEAKTEKDIIPLKDFVKNYMPSRVIPPGKLSAYSNYGTTLAGYLVEEVSGQTFNSYIEKNILMPLGMNNSTFDQKQTAKLAKNMTRGYVFEGGKFEPKDFEFIIVGPAGSLSSTAADMAKFMIAHLQNGRLGQARILKEKTAKEMHAPHFGFDPRMKQMCYGFYQMNMNGLEIIGHEGDTTCFHSMLFLLPKENVGLFVSYNTPGGAKARHSLFQAFMDHYYPAPLPPVAPKDLQKEAAKLNGTYLVNRKPYAKFEKIAMFLPSGLRLKISVQKDNTVQVNDNRLAEIKQPFYFTSLYAKSNQIFKKIDGKMYFSADYPFMVFEKQAWYETATFHYMVYGACIVVFLAALIGWPIVWLIRRRFSAPHFLSWMICLLFAVSLPLIISNLAEGFYKPAAMIPYLAIPLAGAILTIGAVIYTLLAWKNKYWTLWGQIGYSVVTAAMLVYIWWLNYWNLLGFKI